MTKSKGVRLFRERRPLVDRFWEKVERIPFHTCAVNHRKTICMRGHALDTANTYIDPYGYRQCRSCHREKERTRIARLRAANA